MLRRHEWLQAVLSSDGRKLESFIAQSQSTATLDDSQSQGSSRDLSALARVGPCSGYEALKIVEDVKAEAAKFRLCTSKDALKEVSEDLAAPKKLYQTLLTACKKALAELRGAKTRSEAAAAANKKREAKAAAKKAAAGSKSGKALKAQPGTADHAIFQLCADVDVPQIPTSATWEASWRMETSEPFLISGVKTIGKDQQQNEAIDKLLKDFGKAFSDSALKAGQADAACIYVFVLESARV